MNKKETVLISYDKYVGVLTGALIVINLHENLLLFTSDSIGCDIYYPNFIVISRNCINCTKKIVVNKNTFGP